MGLQSLLEESEARQATLEQELQQASDNLGQASNDLLDAQGNLASAVTARETAENNLATSQGIREEKQTDHDEAVHIRDDQVNDLNGEVQVLRDVVAMLKTLLPSGGSGWSEFSKDVACEGNGAARDSACDVANGGGIECCQESALARGFQFVVWWENMCYATTTCDDPYNLVDTVNYHHDGSSLISVTKVSSSPDAGSGGRRRLLSWKKKNQKSSVTQIIKNPKKFAEMSKADPGAVQNIIDMLEQLIADNENTVSAILQHVDDTAQALNDASAQVVADEAALGSAQGDEASAELALSEAETAEASAETAKTEAQGVYDGEIDTLNNEQQVLREVIALLESLLSGGNCEELSDISAECELFLERDGNYCNNQDNSQHCEHTCCLEGSDPGSEEGLSDCPDMCPSDYSPVCGTDGQTYSNDCEMDMVACELGSHIYVDHEGEC